MHPAVRRRHTEAVVLIAVGGALGASLRYLLGGVAGDALLTTLAINGVGSFLLGLMLFQGDVEWILDKRLQYIFGTGFLASFTTYSTFVADIALSAPPIAIGYLVASYVAGFGGVLVSWEIASRLSGGDG